MQLRLTNKNTHIGSQTLPIGSTLPAYLADTKEEIPFGIALLFHAAGTHIVLACLFMPRWPHMIAAGWLCVFAAGCELPRGPISPVPWRESRWFNPLRHQRALAESGDCQDCQAEPMDSAALEASAHEPPHHANRVDSPWPKYHPVPTRPTFEPRGAGDLAVPTEAAPPAE